MFILISLPVHTLIIRELYLTCLLPDWDLLHTAQKVLATLPVSLQVVHVESHQDSGPVPYLKLPLPAKLNIQADALTHTAFTHCSPPTTPPQSPEISATLTLNLLQVTSNLQEITLFHYYTPLQLKYFQTTHWWTPEIFSTVDWLSYSRDLHKLSCGRKLAMFKLANGQWPIYKKLFRCKQQPTHLCPRRCTTISETHDHVLSCPSLRNYSAQVWQDRNDFVHVATVQANKFKTIRAPIAAITGLRCISQPRLVCAVSLNATKDASRAPPSPSFY